MVMGQWSAGYDALNRIASAASASGPYSGMTLMWDIDSFGNRKTQIPTGHIPPQNTPGLTFNNAQNRADQFVYDAAGDVTNDGANQYLYDAEHRVCAVNSLGGLTGYLYDAGGRRVAAPGTTEAVWADSRVRIGALVPIQYPGTIPHRSPHWPLVINLPANTADCAVFTDSADW